MGHFSHFTIVSDASELAKRLYVFWAALCSWHPTVGFWSNGPDFSSRFGWIKSPSFSVSYIKAHEYHFLFSSSQFRILRAFKPPNSLTIRSFIALSKSLQKSSRTSKINSCFSLRKFLLRISLYPLGQPPRPFIFSSTYSEWVGLSV